MAKTAQQLRVALHTAYARLYAAHEQLRRLLAEDR